MNNVDEDLFTCPVCFQSYDFNSTKPHILDKCGHTLCKKCIDTLIESHNHYCPTCRSFFYRSAPNILCLKILEPIIKTKEENEKVLNELEMECKHQHEKVVKEYEKQIDDVAQKVKDCIKKKINQLLHVQDNLKAQKKHNEQMEFILNKLNFSLAKSLDNLLFIQEASLNSLNQIKKQLISSQKKFLSNIKKLNTDCIALSPHILHVESKTFKERFDQIKNQINFQVSIDSIDEIEKCLAEIALNTLEVNNLSKFFEYGRLVIDESEKWMCKVCTVLNPKTKFLCSSCLNIKPQDIPLISSNDSTTNRFTLTSTATSNNSTESKLIPEKSSSSIRACLFNVQEHLATDKVDKKLEQKNFSFAPFNFQSFEGNKLVKETQKTVFNPFLPAASTLPNTFCFEDKKTIAKPRKISKPFESKSFFINSATTNPTATASKPVEKLDNAIKSQSAVEEVKKEADKALSNLLLTTDSTSTSTTLFSFKPLEEKKLTKPDKTIKPFEIRTNSSLTGNKESFFKFGTTNTSTTGTTLIPFSLFIPPTQQQATSQSNTDQLSKPKETFSLYNATFGSTLGATAKTKGFDLTGSGSFFSNLTSNANMKTDSTTPFKFGMTNTTSETTSNQLPKLTFGTNTPTSTGLGTSMANNNQTSLPLFNMNTSPIANSNSLAASTTSTSTTTSPFSFANSAQTNQPISTTSSGFSLFGQQQQPQTQTSLLNNLIGSTTPSTTSSTSSATSSFPQFSFKNPTSTTTPIAGGSGGGSFFSNLLITPPTSNPISSVSNPIKSDAFNFTHTLTNSGNTNHTMTPIFNSFQVTPPTSSSTTSFLMINADNNQPSNKPLSSNMFNTTPSFVPNFNANFNFVGNSSPGASNSGIIQFSVNSDTSAYYAGKKRLKNRKIN